MFWNVNAVTLARVILSSVKFPRGWRKEFNHCILLSLNRVRTDISVKDEICLERVIRSYKEAEDFHFPLTASFILTWLILLSGANVKPLFLILPSLCYLSQRNELELGYIVDYCDSSVLVRFATLTLPAKYYWLWRTQILFCNSQMGNKCVSAEQHKEVPVPNEEDIHLHVLSHSFGSGY